MNPEPSSRADAIRSDIHATRQRMDETMDALGERLKPRHLLDEALGYLRGAADDGQPRLHHLREKVTESCDTAMHSVIDSVKRNPVPAALIGAGVAWLIYSNRRDSHGSYDRERYDRDAGRSEGSRQYDPDTHYDRPLEYPTSSLSGSNWSEQGKPGQGEWKERLSDAASSATEQVKDKLSHAGEAARETMSNLQHRASEIADRARETSRRVYRQTREQVVHTVHDHPFEVGLAALAVGLVVGLALPTPEIVNRRLGPTADRLRERTREAGSELMEKGKSVAEAAVGAAKEEAAAQGLMAEAPTETMSPGATPPASPGATA